MVLLVEVPSQGYPHFLHDSDTSIGLKVWSCYDVCWCAAKQNTQMRREVCSQKLFFAVSESWVNPRGPWRLFLEAKQAPRLGEALCA